RFGLQLPRVRMLSAKFGRGIITATIAIGVTVLLLAATAHAQQTGRVFQYKGVGAVPAEEIPTADVQHALIWTRHYVAMADGGYGPYTKNAIRAWLSSKGYLPSDILTREQAVELITEGIRRRDEFGWALLVDDAVGFSVGMPTK